MNKVFNKGLAVVLSLLFLLSAGNNAQAVAANEGIQPLASDYLSHYSAYVYSPGNGKIEVWFTVHGNGIIDEIGALTIVLRESTDRTNWRTAKTFRYKDYDDMLFMVSQWCPPMLNILVKLGNTIPQSLPFGAAAEVKVIPGR